MAININSSMSLNTTIFSNSFMPVPIDSVGSFGEYDQQIDMTNFVDYKTLNSVPRMNYSSFDYLPHANPNVSSRDPDNTSNITNIAFNTAEKQQNLHDNPFKISIVDLQEFNKYATPRSYAMTAMFDDYVVQEGDKNYGHGIYVQNVVVPSLFNPFLSINVKGMMKNLPLTNSKDKSNDGIDAKNDFFKKDGSRALDKDTIHANRWENKDEYDTSDCSIRTLVKLSKTPASPGAKYSVLGRATYKYADFMYCKDLGKVANNYMITLRRFPVPVGDNISTIIGNEYLEECSDDYSDMNITPDIGRLVCWLGDDNKLEDIVKFSFWDSWKEFNAEIYEKDSQEEDAQRGVIGSIVNLANPAYRRGVAQGKWGSGNLILNRLGGNIGSGQIGLLSANGSYENGDAAAVMQGRMYDKNKIYEPKGTIRDTHQYEGKLTFTHEFTLVFDYELRAYENINPKSAFLDLLGNILKVTYRTGTFWGGENGIYGAPGNKAGWAKANSFIDSAIGGAKDFATKFISGEIDFNSLLGSLSDKFTNLIGTLTNPDTYKGMLDSLNSDKGKNAVSSVVELLGGMFKNAMGRPAVYALNSLLSGDPVGQWHVMIGNPRNPILSMGNLIISSATNIQQYGPLGIDDFPTGIKVTVTLKHAKSRDASEIANMYTNGIGLLHMKPTVSNYMNYLAGPTGENSNNADQINLETYGTPVVGEMMKTLWS